MRRWACKCGQLLLPVGEEPPPRCPVCGCWPLPLREEPIEDEEREQWRFPI